MARGGGLYGEVNLPTFLMVLYYAGGVKGP
jgi:hypothetical protein